MLYIGMYHIFVKKLRRSIVHQIPSPLYILFTFFFFYAGNLLEFIRLCLLFSLKYFQNDSIVSELTTSPSLRI